MLVDKQVELASKYPVYGNRPLAAAYLSACDNLLATNLRRQLMQPDSPTPPQPTPPTEPSVLEEMAALTALFNPEIIWKEEELLDTMDEQEAQRLAAASIPTTPDQP